MNKLLRTVKRIRTARKVAKTNKDVSIFEVTTHGYFDTGDNKGEVNKILIRDRDYQIFTGTFYQYQKPLRPNQSVKRITI